MFSLINCCNLNMICCLNIGVVLDQVLKAWEQLSTASFISAWVDFGTKPMSSLVAGLYKSMCSLALDSTALLLIQSLTVGY